MKYHSFPNTDLSVSQLCFGCWGIASDFHWGDRIQEESVGAILAAVDHGINFFDTAPLYGDGSSESLMGRVFAEHGLREKVIIASKVRPDKMRPEQIYEECSQSLQRLQTDYIDLYQTHWTPRDVPLGETWNAMQRLQQEGKVRHIGVCNMGLEDLAEVIPPHKPLTNQLPYNLLWRMIEPDILPRCQNEQIGVLAYSPLMHGLLADNYQSAAEVPDGRARSRHFNTERPLARHGEPGCEQETFAALERIREIAKRLGRAMAEVALSWTIQQPGVVSVIAGARNAEQLQANIHGMDSTLSTEIVAQLNDATDRLKIALGANPDMWDGEPNSRYR